MHWDLLITNVHLVTGLNDPIQLGSLAVKDGRIAAIGEIDNDAKADVIIDGQGHYLSPGFIDVHTHDDIAAIKHPEMLTKLSQGVTTVIVGNCGISASPAVLNDAPPDPMDLLGDQEVFVYPQFSDYAKAVDQTIPAVNVAALIGHTTLRSQIMDSYDRAASDDEIEKMKQLLGDALEQGAIGFSTGLAYRNAQATPSSEVEALLEVVGQHDACYSTHMRNERENLFDSIDESLSGAKLHDVPLTISHLKCADPENWGKSIKALSKITQASQHQTCCCDCYPYDACSTTLDLWRVRHEFEIRVTWSKPHPEQANRLLNEIADDWGLSMEDAAKKLMPAGAIYHNMSDDDVSRIVAHPMSMIGSDGLPSDPNPHPRLWGTFSRVLAHYCRDRGLMSLDEAVRKMTYMPSKQFGLKDRGHLRVGAWADLTLFDFENLQSKATYTNPTEPTSGIELVVVNGQITYKEGQVIGRAGQLLKRNQ